MLSGRFVRCWKKRIFITSYRSVNNEVMDEANRRERL